MTAFLLPIGFARQGTNVWEMRDRQGCRIGEFTIDAVGGTLRFSADAGRTEPVYSARDLRAALADRGWNGDVSVDECGEVLERRLSSKRKREVAA